MSIFDINADIRRARILSSEFQWNSKQSGLPKESVVNVSQMLTIDKQLFDKYVGTLPESKWERIDKGLPLVLPL